MQCSLQPIHMTKSLDLCCNNVQLHLKTSCSAYQVLGTLMFSCTHYNKNGEIKHQGYYLYMYVGSPKVKGALHRLKSGYSVHSHTSLKVNYYLAGRMGH